MKLNNLKAMMDDKGLSPEKLARMGTGFSNMTVRRAIAGGNIHPLIASAIARAVGKRVCDLE